MNMKRLLNSAKFWMAILDVVVSLGILWAGYLVGDPELLDVIKQTIIALQVAFAAVIGGIAWEDSAAKKAGQ
jgi:hypothetical protein